jgi:hypothetical protein
MKINGPLFAIRHLALYEAAFVVAKGLEIVLNVWLHHSVNFDFSMSALFM